MGTCWSEPPVAPAVVSHLKRCGFCGVWVKGNEYCEPCLQKNAMHYVAPSATMYVPHTEYQTPQYTYAVPYQQQQMYPYYHQAPPPQYQQPQQQQGISTGVAVLGGFMLGSVMEDILDPNE